MKKMLVILTFILILPSTLVSANDSITGSPEKGQAFWVTEHITKGKTRSCSNCHTDNPANMGKHIRTGKIIKPLAPSVNPNSLTDTKKVAKWFLRNCKWTLGRECTAQEKADVLAYLTSK